MGNLADCLAKAAKAGRLEQEDVDFVSKKATELQEILPRRAAEQGALKFMLDDAHKELTSIHGQLGLDRAKEDEGWVDENAPLPISGPQPKAILDEIAEFTNDLPVIGSLKRGLMQSGIGAQETVAKYGMYPVVRGLSEAINFVAPESGAAKFAQHLTDQFWGATQALKEERDLLGKESAKEGAVGEVSHAIGAMAGDLPSIVMTGGLLPELKMGSELVNALRTGAASMTLPAMRAGTDAAEEARKKGQGEAGQFAAWLQGTTEMMALGAVPMATSSGASSLVGRFAERAAKSVPLASGVVEAQRDIENLIHLAKGEQQQPFDIVEHIKAAAPLVLVGGAIGRSTYEKPTVFQKVHGFREDMLNQVAWIKAKAETEGIKEVTPEHVMEWGKEWRAENARVLGVVADPTAIKGIEIGKQEGKRVADFINRPSEWTPFKKELNLHIAENQKAQDDVIRLNKAQKAAVPDGEARKGGAMWIEAGGDMGQLVKWGSTVKSAEGREAYKQAGALTPKELEVAKAVDKRFKDLLIEANLAGVDVKERQNYITHMIHNPGADVRTGTTRGVSDYFRFKKHREYDTFYDAFQDGAKPKTLDMVDILSIYELNLRQAINNKKFVDRLQQAQASDGRMVILPSKEKYTDKGGDYKSLENIGGMGRLVVHPDYYKHLKNVLGRSGIDEWLDSKVSDNPFMEYGKGITKSLIEAQKYMKGTMFSLSGFHQTTEALHAIGHRVNPFRTKTREINLNDPKQFDAAAHGLMLRPDRLSQNIFMEGSGGTTYNLVTKMARKHGGEVGEKLANFIDNYSHYLFEDFIPRLKMDTYEAMVARNGHLYDKELKSGKVNPDQIKELSADQANAAYGHLNYTKMGRSPTIQQAMQIGLLAPDFFEARARFAGQAGKTLTTGSKTGWEQLSALAFLAALQYTGARIMNYLDHGEYEWDPERAFMVKTDFFGMLKDKRWLGLRSVPEDALKFATDPGQFMRNRLSPLASLGAANLFKTDWKGEPTNLGKSLTDMLAGIVPLPLQGYTNEILQPDRAQGISPLETILKSTGLQIHRVSPLGEAYKLADHWMKEHNREEWEQRQKSVHPQSKYTALRYALEDGDEELAKAEAAKLGKDPGKGFKLSLSHPFTGSLAQDQVMYKSLDAHDKKIFDAAIKRKALLAQRYRAWVGAIGGEPITEAYLMERMRKAKAKQ